MEPTILNGSIVLASLLPFFFREPKTNDIVAFADQQTKKIFIKRIVKHEGQKFYLTGDNKHDSLDSRKIGWVGRNDIVGKVILRLHL